MTEHARTIRIIKYVVLLLFLYSYTIAARILNPEQSEILVFLVIFGTVCGVLYGIYLVSLVFEKVYILPFRMFPCVLIYRYFLILVMFGLISMLFIIVDKIRL